jgi:transposase
VSYREVHVVEVREVVRLWSLGESLRAISRLTGLDRKTVRGYVKAARVPGCEGARGPYAPSTGSCWRAGWTSRFPYAIPAEYTADSRPTSLSPRGQG